eukprot:CCRYP_000866-RA/>CCRYP_000866-RA protein AED:0.01 eAED:0.01 QI:2252/1/1/1/0.33/0.25/4/1891/550
MKKNFVSLLLILGLPLSDAFSNQSLLRKPSPTASCRANSLGTLPRFVSTESNIEINNDQANPDQSEYALLLPGHTVRIQIGDVTASRKAWKKRRRNSSPILIPCSILGMSREWMVRWNVMTLLHMIGEETPSAGGAVGTTCGKLGRAYRQRLGGDLREHAKALGYDSVESLLQSLFDERIQAEYGIRTFIEPQHGNLMLTTSLTRRQARSFSSSAGMVQFRPTSDFDDEAALGADSDLMVHTGMAQIRLSPNESGRSKFAQEPLGAAIRVSPYDDALERYKPGDEFNAFVYSYDLAGDNESPLLVLTVDDPRGKSVPGSFGASTRVFKRRSSKSSILVNDASLEHDLSELNVGDGPIQAIVVAVSPHSNSVFVDCGVGRTRGKKYGGGMAKVLGMLRFDDMLRDESDIAPGDVVEVYIKSVFNQSGRFMVSMDEKVKDKKAKEWKREKEADKRIERLSNKFKGEDIESLIGSEFDGVVKATSKTGESYYVQPFIEGEDEVSLPVGVASFLEEELDKNTSSYSAGDSVRVRLEGIDRKRGQLSLTLLKLAP